MRILIAVIALALVATPSFAQSTGVPAVNDFTINGNGSGGTSMVASDINGANNTFAVSASGGGLGIIFAHSTNAAVGALPLGGGSVDIDLTMYTVILDGPGLLAPGPLSALAWTDSGGMWSLNIAGGGNVSAGQAFGHFQCAIFDPATGGIEPTQAHTGTGSLPLWVGVPDDGSLNVFLSAPVTFYGVAYPDIWLNSNGNMTLGGGDPDFTNTEAEYLANFPRISVWEDFNPSAVTSGPTTYGEVAGTFVLNFVNCDNWGSAGDNNTFTMGIELATGIVTITTQQMDLAAGNAGLPIVGITPGGGLSMSNHQDLSTVGGTPYLAANATDAIYEEFLISGVFDLANPTTITFTPSGGLGLGPYLAN